MLVIGGAVPQGTLWLDRTGVRVVLDFTLDGELTEHSRAVLRESPEAVDLLCAAWVELTRWQAGIEGTGPGEVTSE